MAEASLDKRKIDEDNVWHYLKVLSNEYEYVLLHRLKRMKISFKDRYLNSFWDASLAYYVDWSVKYLQKPKRKKALSAL